MITFAATARNNITDNRPERLIFGEEMVRWIMFGAVSFEHMPEQLLSHQPEQKQNTEGPDHFLYDHSMMWLSSLSCGYSISSGHTYSTYSLQPHSCAITFTSDLSSGLIISIVIYFIRIPYNLRDQSKLQPTEHLPLDLHATL